MNNKLLVTLFGMILLSSYFVIAADNKVWFGRNESAPSQMIPVLLTTEGILRTDMNFSSADIWSTNLGLLSNANTTQFFNDGGFLNINQTWINNLSEGKFIRVEGEEFTDQITQFNFTFSNTSLPTLQNFNTLRLQNLNDSSTTTLGVVNDQGLSVSLFASSSNFAPSFGLNNTVGIAAQNTDLILSVATPGKNIIMRVINSTGGLIDSLVVESDGNVILQNDLISNFSSIFYDTVGDHFTRVNSEGTPFNGIATNATWSGHNGFRDEGEIAFLNTAENKTLEWLVVERNFSYSGIGNSFGLVPEYLAEENFTELDGTINMTKLSSYPFLCNFSGVKCQFFADTRGNAVDDIAGGPLLWTMGDLEIWQSAVIHQGLEVFRDLEVILDGDNDADIFNGSLHIADPVTFITGFNKSDPVTIFDETFPGTLGRFANLQTDAGNWLAVADPLCASGICARSTGIDTVGNIFMEGNGTGTNINETELSFVYSLINVVGLDTFNVYADNNNGSGNILLFSDTGTDTLVSQTIILPVGFENVTTISIEFECDVTNPIKQCFVDDVKLNGTAMIDTTAEQEGFQSEICFSDGDRSPSTDECNRGIVYNASSDTIFFNGPVNITGAVGGLTGSGSSNTIAKWITSSSLGNSNIVDTGTEINLTTNTNVEGNLNNLGNISFIASDPTQQMIKFNNFFEFSAPTGIPNKISLFSDNVSNNHYGFGVSAGSLDYISDGNHTFFTESNLTMTIDSNGSVTATGNVTAEFFKGDGSELTNLPAQNPFNQSLNTNDNTTFANLTVTNNISADTVFSRGFKTNILGNMWETEVKGIPGPFSFFNFAVLKGTSFNGGLNLGLVQTGLFIHDFDAANLSRLCFVNHLIETFCLNYDQTTSNLELDSTTAGATFTVRETTIFAANFFTNALFQVNAGMRVNGTINNTDGIILTENISSLDQTTTVNPSQHHHNDTNTQGGIIPHITNDSNRSLGTLFTNTGDRWEIHRVTVDSFATNAGDLAFVTAFVNGSRVAGSGYIQYNNFNGEFIEIEDHLTFNVAPGETYQVNATVSGNGAVLLLDWLEDPR